jgi:expansin (peptidoglycan-binding protein)
MPRLGCAFRISTAPQVRAAKILQHGKSILGSEGRVSINWTFVACDVTGPVQYKYKAGSNAYSTAVQVQNSRYPIAKLESSADDATWTEAVRQDYDYFLNGNGNGFGTGVVHVRITAESGEALEDTLPPMQASLVTPGQAQFQ